MWLPPDAGLRMSLRFPRDQGEPMGLVPLASGGNLKEGGFHELWVRHQDYSGQPWNGSHGRLT